MWIPHEVSSLFPALIIKLTLFSSMTLKANRIQVEEREPYWCPSSCFCDESSIYVSCIGDSAWDLSFPPIPRTVVRLEIRNYKVATLTSRHLLGMTALEELKLQQASIDSIANGTFAAINKLARLDLGENLIENLTREALAGLEGSLRYIDLSSNQLRNVEEAFARLGAVEQLNLRKNRLSNLTVNTFVGLNKLQYLNLDSNQITFIELGSFIHLPNLAHLLISNNPLSSLSRLDSVTTRLQYIDVSNIGLTMVPQGIDPFVRDLRLARNQIRRITSGDIDNYPYLSLLVLDDNQIEDIEPDALGRQEYLIRLWINGNQLKKVPLTLPSSLRELYLEENLIEQVDYSSLKGLTNLERLFLRRNQIHLLEDNCFSDLKTLQLLDLQSNRLSNLTNGIFANLSRLESLDLSQNQLKHLNGPAFLGLTNLKVLRLSRVASTGVQFDEDLFEPLESLETLDLYDSPELVRRLLNSTKVLESLKNVQELDVMHNKLENLREDFSAYFPYLKTIKLNENLWRCDKSILWLLNWIKRAPSSLTFSMSYDLKCSSPPALQFKPIRILTRSDLVEPLFSKGTPSTELLAASSSVSAAESGPPDSIVFREQGVSSSTSMDPYKSHTMYSTRSTINSHSAELTTFSKETTALTPSSLPVAKSNQASRSVLQPVKLAERVSRVQAKGEKTSVKKWNSFILPNERHQPPLGNNSKALRNGSRNGVQSSSSDDQSWTRRERKHIPEDAESKSTVPVSVEYIKDAFHRRDLDSAALAGPRNALLLTSCLFSVCTIAWLLYMLAKYKKHEGLNKFISEQWNRSLRRNDVSYSCQKDEVGIAAISRGYPDQTEADLTFRNSLYFEMSDETIKR